jgi:tetratricopeptide (TPR) repeat protein
MVWSVAQMGYGYGVNSVLQRLGEPTGEIAHFCFEGAMERIRGKPAHKLLMALSLFATDASREALGYVANLIDLDRDEGLVNLQRLSLSNKNADRFTLLPLTKQYSQVELLKGKDEDLRTRWGEFLGKLLARLTKRRYESIQEFRVEADNLLEYMDWMWQEMHYDDFVRSAHHIELLLWVIGRWKAWEKVLASALKIGVIQDDLDIQARYSYRLAILEFFRGNLKKAVDFAKQAEGIFEVQGHEIGYARSLIRTGWLLAHQGSFSLADQKLRKAMQILSQAGIKRYVSRARRSLAYIDIQKGDLEAARQNLQKAIELRGGEDVLLIGSAVDYRMLSEIDIAEDNLPQAREHMHQCLSIAQQLNVKQDIAEAKLGLAEIEEKAVCI